LENLRNQNIIIQYLPALMAFQYSPDGFEEYFIENGTLEGMATKVKTEEEYAITEKKYGMVYKEPN